MATLPDLGGYLRDQREQAQLSLRQLAERTGISNPYLSQIERGLKKPSADILQAIAKGLAISAEQVYVRAGLLDPLPEEGQRSDPDVRAAIRADNRLTKRQQTVLLELYASFVEDEPRAANHR